jgi:hypothetical protein
VKRVSLTIDASADAPGPLMQQTVRNRLRRSGALLGIVIVEPVTVSWSDTNGDVALLRDRRVTASAYAVNPVEGGPL